MLPDSHRSRLLAASCHEHTQRTYPQVKCLERTAPARGYVTKTISSEELTDAITRVAEGLI